MLDRLRRALPFLALFVAGLIVRGYVNAARMNPGHGDVADYFSVAKNLFEGRGFTVDYIWTFIVDPKGIPNPSNTWWMPLPSILSAIGFFLTGGVSYGAAKWTMIVIASLIPVVTFVTARELLGSRPLAYAAAILAVGFHLFLDQTCAPLSYGPYTLFGGGAFAVLLASRTRPKLFPLAGLLLGLSYLSRGDSLVLLLPLVVVFLASRRVSRSAEPTAVDRPRITFAQALLCLGLFLAVVSPWLARNVAVMGRPMPAGQAKMIWLKDYTQWYTARPETLTPTSYLELGALGIVDQKTWAIGEVVNYTLTCMYRSVPRPIQFKLSDVTAPIWMVGFVMTPLLWIGLVVLWRRRQHLPFLYLGALLVFYGVLFSALSEQSYRTGLFSLLPTFVCAIVAGIDFCFGLVRRFAPRAADLGVGVCALGLSMANVRAVEPYLHDKARLIERMLVPYREFGAWAKAENLTDETFFSLNPWEFTLETGLKSVMAPPDDANSLLAIARRFHVTRFAIDKETLNWLANVRPGLASLIKSGALERIPGSPGLIYFRFKPEALGGSG